MNENVIKIENRNISLLLNNNEDLFNIKNRGNFNIQNNQTTSNRNDIINNDYLNINSSDKEIIANDSDKTSSCRYFLFSDY